MEATQAKAAGKPVTSLLPFWVSITFNMQPQTQSNWCWAATAASTSLYYLAASTWTQCGVANADLPRTDCCTSPVPGLCNVPWYLDTALGVTGNFVSMTGPISNEAVIAELQAGRAIGARVAWANGGAHFVVIFGYSDVMQTKRFTIADPIYGDNSIFASFFRDGYYQGSGTWTHTYFTQAPSP
jgi:hypothetical protein